MMRKFGSFVGIAGLLALSIAPALSVSAQEDGIESVCLVTDLGRVNDGGFNQSAYEGMIAAAEDYELDSNFIETQAQTDYEANINTCLSEEYDAIVTVGFLMTDTTLAAAQANPDTYFIGVDQGYAEVLPNLVGIQFREDQAGFLVGAMAALMTESGTVAGVYGIAIPPVVKFRNGFEQGVAYADPEVEALGVYIDSFTSPERGASAAEQFIGEGADVIFGAGGPTGSGGILFAAQQEVMAIGVDQDEYFTTFGEGETEGAEYLITSAVKRVDNGVYDMIEALVEGEGFPEEGVYILTVENEGIGFAEAHDAEVPEEVTAQVQEILDMMIAGEIETGVDPVSGELLSEMATEEATAEATPEATAES